MSNPPLRRSARAASQKPEEPKAAALKAAVAKTTAPKAEKSTRPVARTPSRSKKRAATPEASPPPTKRSRAKAGISDAEDAKKVANKKAPATTVPKKVTKQPTVNGLTPVHESKPHFNPLPTANDHPRPAQQLFVWGAGNFGQFGWGADQLGEFAVPKRNTCFEKKMEEGAFGGQGAGLEAIAAGGLHTLFIDEKGTVWSCGVNDDAALGRVTKDVPDPDNPGKFIHVDELTAVPYPLQSLVDEGFRAVRIAAGDSISAAISDNGELRVWGSFRAAEGSLGFSGDVRLEFLPKAILDLPTKAGDAEKAVSVVSGNNHLLVLTTHGNIYAWGAGEQGQLGRKILERRKIHGTVPEKITLGTRHNRAVLVGAGNYHSFAIDEEGDVWGWGLNTMGQTGTGVAEPKSMSDEVRSPRIIRSLCQRTLGESIVQIIGGEHHTLFLTSFGKVYACGRCDGGQLGISDEVAEYTSRKNPDFVPEPMLVPFPDPDDPIVFISAGTHNNMAISQAGALYAWGEESQGELGVNEKEAKTPTVVVRRDGGAWKAVSVACGGQHTLGMFRKKT
ncbi:regulator of chromosome condensation 1/beta-lactamase-inhibitor protein II [Suillus discolor]|uniref:Regulator of chromosome condensation 1/beta-lactamase-inhibitor protein II n=1 Tax=Suillus discolor TaxID=1912936 RepID=A0A9P7JXY2_9AGAM|nr:regulator of chromosome condensation 1/beta-lactamase-inhibitor protein II [Suillus discolor]KAG2115974.1 regulator of chromosome condensation 1/beta-lactamase-inhibitor protein II [Suillus discolor]